MIQGDNKIRKVFVIFGLILTVAGIALAVYSELGTEARIEELSRWNFIYPSTLNPPSEPENSTFWGHGPMQTGDSFKLNIASSGTVRVLVSSVQQDQTTTSIFNRTGTHFEDEVATGGGGTFQVEIKNEGATAVNVSGNVIAQRTTIVRVTVYPYIGLGVLAVLVGLVSAGFGVLAKSRGR